MRELLSKKWRRIIKFTKRQLGTALTNLEDHVRKRLVNALVHSTVACVAGGIVTSTRIEAERSCEAARRMVKRRYSRGITLTSENEFRQLFAG